MNIDEAIEHAAEHLPERMRIALVVEKGSASVELWGGGEGVGIDLEEAGVSIDLSFAEQIIAAVEIARAW